MKYFLSLFFLLCTLCAFAQIDIKIVDKPGTTDSARWEISYMLENGTEQTNTTPWDTLPKVIEFGYRLFHDGGEIGGTYLYGAQPTEAAMRVVVSTNKGISPNRDSVRAQLWDRWSDPMQRDTTYDYKLTGTWNVGPGCVGFFGDTINISRGIDLPITTDSGSPNRLYITDWLRPPSYIYLTGPNSFRKEEVGGGSPLLWVEITEGVYRSEEGCELTKQN